MYGFRSKVALLPTSKSMDSFLVLIYSLGNDLPSSFENLTSVANTALCLNSNFIFGHQMEGWMVRDEVGLSVKDKDKGWPQ